MDTSDDFAKLDDTTLFARRAEMRAELERLPPGSRAHATLAATYEKSTTEIDNRARTAWAKEIQELKAQEAVNKGANQ